MRMASSLMVVCLTGFYSLTGALAAEKPDAPAATDIRGFIRVAKDRRHFVFSRSGSEFTPWGFNYDHDASNRLLEDYWNEEWDAVSGDFKQMKDLGANTVRIHLQVSKFMRSAQGTNQQSWTSLHAFWFSPNRRSADPQIIRLRLGRPGTRLLLGS